MDTAKKYIDSDDAFFLHRINCLDLFLKCGITLFVDDLPNFHDMTLIQYAIAKRKPKTLKDMLEASYYQCQVPFKNILTPETSNTKGNLLNLAIEFGSKNDKYGKNYEEVDIECLKVIVEFCQKLKNKENFNIDMENINGETPLMIAIKYDNKEACQYLISNGADILHDCKNSYEYLISNGADILHDCKNYLKNPLWYLLVNTKSLSLFDLINEDVLGYNTYTKVHNFCSKIYENKEELNEINNEFTKKFFDVNFKGVLQPIRLDELLNINNKKPETSTPEPKQQSDVIKCSNCLIILDENTMRKCPDCGKIFCEACMNTHEC